MSKGKWKKGNRTLQVRFNVNEAEKEILEQLVLDSGLSLSSYLRYLIDKASKEV